MAIVTTDDKHYKAIADMIREMGLPSDNIKPEEMAEKIYDACDIKFSDGYIYGTDQGYKNGYEVGNSEGFDKGAESGRAERNAVMFGILSGEINELKEEHLYGLKKVGGYMFSGNKNLLSAKIPETVTQIGGCAFENCSIKNVTLSKGLQGIQVQAFNGCTNLTSLTIPASVAQIRSKSLCIGSKYNKATIIFEGTTPPTIEADTFDASKLEKIIVPVAYDDVFKEATNLSIFADYIKGDWFYESNLTVDKNASFIDEGVCNIARVHRYLVIEASATSHTGEYITGGDKIATLEEISLAGVGSVEYGRDISCGYNCIDLYNYYTEEELNSLIGVANHSVGFTYTPDEHFIGAGGMDFGFRYGFSEVIIE